MKTTLFLSTIAAGLLALSTATFAQDAGAAWAQAYGDANTSATQHATSIGGFAGSDLGYHPRVTGRHHTAR
jgi:hypothetical protein